MAIGSVAPSALTVREVAAFPPRPAKLNRLAPPSPPRASATTRVRAGLVETAVAEASPPLPPAAKIIPLPPGPPKARASALESPILLLAVAEELALPPLPAE